MTLRIPPDKLVEESKSPLVGIASEWKRVPLGHVASVQNGFAFPSGQFSRDSGVPLIRIRDVGSKSTEARFSGGYDPAFVVRRGDIVLGMDGDFRVARWGGGDALLNQRVCRLRLLDPDLYDEQFLHHSAPRIPRSRQRGNLCRNREAPLFGDGQRVASTSTAPCRAASHRRGDRGGVLEARRGRCVPRGGKAAIDNASPTIHRIVRLGILDALGNSEPVTNSGHWDEYRSSRSDPFATVTLPPLRSGWSWVRAGSACLAVECGGTPAADRMSSEGEVPFVKVYNLTTTGILDFSVRPTFISAETHRRQGRSSAKPGDVLTNIVGPPLGKVALVPATYPEWNMNQAVVMFRPSSALDKRFLSLLLQSRFVMERLRAHVDGQRRANSMFR